jgi:hypothetical protein
MRVRLTRKLATCLDGVDLSDHRCGDVFEMTRHEAKLLIAEGWAVPVVSSEPRRMSSGVSGPLPRIQAENRGHRPGRGDVHVKSEKR